MRVPEGGHRFGSLGNRLLKRRMAGRGVQSAIYVSWRNRRAPRLLKRRHRIGPDPSSQ